jgi:hypothetical protein
MLIQNKILKIFKKNIQLHGNNNHSGKKVEQVLEAIPKLTASKVLWTAVRKSEWKLADTEDQWVHKTYILNEVLGLMQIQEPKAR